MLRTLGCDVQVLPRCDALFIHPIPPSDLIPKSLQGLHPMLWRDPRSQPKKKIPGRTNNLGASLPSSFWLSTFNCYFWCFWQILLRSDSEDRRPCFGISSIGIRMPGAISLESDSSTLECSDPDLHQRRFLSISVTQDPFPSSRSDVRK